MTIDERIDLLTERVVELIVVANAAQREESELKNVGPIFERGFFFTVPARVCQPRAVAGRVRGTVPVRRA